MLRYLRKVIMQIKDDEVSLRILQTLYAHKAINSANAISIRKLSQLANLPYTTVRRALRSIRGRGRKLLWFVHYPEPRKHNRLYLNQAGTALVEAILKGIDFTADEVIKIASLIPDSRYNIAIKRRLLSIRSEISDSPTEHTSEHTFSQSEHTFWQSEHTNPYNNPSSNPLTLETLRTQKTRQGDEQELAYREVETEKLLEEIEQEAAKQTNTELKCQRCGKFAQLQTWRVTDMLREHLSEFPTLAEFHGTLLCGRCARELNALSAFAILRKGGKVKWQ